MDNNIASKIEKLSKTVMKDAREEKDKICEQMRIEREKRIGEKEDEFLRDAYEQIQSTAASVHKQDSERVLKAQNEAKRSLLLKREQIIDEVFARAEKRLSEYARGDEYRAALCEKISQALGEAGEGRKVVCLCERDGGLWEPRAEVTLETVDTAELIGGVKVINLDRNIAVNYSYRTLLDNERSGFLAASGMSIL